LVHTVKPTGVDRYQHFNKLKVEKQMIRIEMWDIFQKGERTDIFQIYGLTL
jgi:hypothetical protein